MFERTKEKLRELMARLRGQCDRCGQELVEAEWGAGLPVWCPTCDLGRRLGILGPEVARVDCTDIGAAAMKAHP